MQFSHEAQALVEAPLSEVFAYWSDIRRLPRMLSHVRAIAMEDAEDIARLVIVLEGRHLEFAVQRTMCGEGTICWQSLGQNFLYVLAVGVQPGPGGTTCVTVNVSYDPPGFLTDIIESLGVCRFFKHTLDHDLKCYEESVRTDALSLAVPA